MEFNSSELSEFNARLQKYSKRKKILKHKTVRESVGGKEETERKVGNFVVKVLKEKHALEKATVGKGTSYLQEMMDRHKRRALHK
jgi:hypothetical protein